MASPSARCPATDIISENSRAVFPLFPRLPPELRRKIWMYYLTDATPQMYRFTLRYPHRLSYNPWRNHLCPGDQVFLRLPQCIRGSEDKHRKDRPDGAGFPEYILRFNSVKDIVVFHAAWEDQEAAVKIANLRGSLPDAFLKIPHVDIAVGGFQMVHNRPLRYGMPRYECGCATEQCQVL